jgi:hypothetical protein
MSKPATKAIRTRLQQRSVPAKNLDTWARFLTCLDWQIINSLVRMALSSGTHPALAAGLTARTTRDENVKATLTTHLEAKAQ